MGQTNHRQRRGIGMWLVIVSKALTALLLFGAFVMLVLAGKTDPTDFLTGFVSALFKGNPPGFVVAFVVTQTATLFGSKLIALAAATLAYGLLETVEALGLATRQRWAEWLTIAVTASFLPWECYELAKEPTAIKGATLAMNLAILIFLIARRFRERRSKRGLHLRFAPAP